MAEHLFVYGTLRQGYDLRLMDKVRHLIRYIGQGKVNADLYDLGRYPGAVRRREATEVIGDVFELMNPESVLRTLDRYEGIGPGKAATEFVRRRSRVKLRSGQTVTAWVYWYNLEPAGKIRIKHKNYLNYLKNKRTH
ncbi:MAG TPA: gamma-glutamylcyclotransferase family protein [Puia sp.]|jgi:gamma-glutamylcyclotransferase (GGCT)/AIG2-like uncharacterized protein YtfP|nr:gamma-glutamylcyclotransferase family protein [Puia sp.]